MFDEYRFADKKVAKTECNVEVLVGWFMHKQFNRAANRGGTAFLCSPMASFHNAGTATGNDAKACLR